MNRKIAKSQSGQDPDRIVNTDKQPVKFHLSSVNLFMYGKMTHRSF
jgi:hypothetical protein